MHRLLKRQLQRFSASTDALPGDWAGFLSTVEAAYLNSDNERVLLLNTLELNSNELFDANTKLREDIQRRQKIEEELFREKELAHITLASIADGVITTDANERILYFNSAAERFLGGNATEVIGQPIERFFYICPEGADNVFENPIHMCLVSDTLISQRKATLINRGGEKFDVENSAAPTRNREGTIVGAVLVVRDVSHARKLEKQLSWQATHDSLTGLPNRREFERELEQALQDVVVRGKQHVLCYLDLDHFKLVNDTCGHAAGDRLLQQISGLLLSKLREGDVFARLGGDEFGIILKNCTTFPAERIAKNLCKLISDFRFSWNSKSFIVGVSIGVKKIIAEGEDVFQVLQDADAACYLAKNLGRNCVQLFDSSDTHLMRHRSEARWAEAITSALEYNGFQLFYQTIQSLTNPNERHTEILLRMSDETSGLISPAVFISAAERYHLMPKVDRWVVKQVLALLDAHPELVTEFGMFCINLSGQSLGDDVFLNFLFEALQNTRVSMQSLCFEITETAAVHNLNKALQLIDSLRARGCLLSLDDFGSGVSSFNYLKNFHVDYVKIDGGFVRDMLMSKIDHAMVESINNIGHVMGLKTIAEFVESEEIIAALKKLGVDYAQGYAINRPKPFVPGLGSADLHE